MFVLLPHHSLPSPPPSPVDPSDSSVPRPAFDNAPPPPPQPLPQFVLFFIQTTFIWLMVFFRSNPTQRSASRSRTILNFLKPKIRLTIPIPHLPSPSSPTFPGPLLGVRAPSPLDTRSAKERRDTALRERGLLPPLQKDLSRLEREKDRHLPVIYPAEETVVTINSPTGTETVTAADLIKREWEAKHRSGEDDEERFKSFRFGVSALVAVDVQESEQPYHKDTSSQAPSFERQDKLGFSSKPRQIIVLDGAGRSQNPTERNHELGQLSPSLLPLPLSPALTPPSSPKPNLKPVSSSAIDLYSPSLGALPPSPSESTAKHGLLDETNLELVLSIPTGLTTPTISLSPVAEEPEPMDARGLQRNVSVSESSFSLATPSLGTSSRSTIMSSLFTTDSLKTIGGRSIPMIVESPIKEGHLPELAIPNTIPEDSDAEVQQDLPDEYQKIKARRNRAIFGQDPSKRLRVSASLTNVRRSVANTLSRTKPSDGSKYGDTLDATHSPLPHSPTFPLPWTGGRRSLEDAMTITPRRAVSPTLHNQASLLLKTSEIEDEEARRVAELAFL